MENPKVIFAEASEFRKALKDDIKEVVRGLLKEIENSKKPLPLYSRKELARLSGNTEQTLIAHEKKGILESLDVGGRKKYRPEEVQRYLGTLK